MLTKTSSRDPRETSLIGPGEGGDRGFAEGGGLMMESAKLTLLRQGPQVLVVIDAWVAG